MVGLGLTRLEPLRTFAVSAPNRPDGGGLGGPPTGPYSIESLRVRAIDAARLAGDSGLADQLREVCCWAPAAASIRERPLSFQSEGFERFVDGFPGDDQLAQVLFYTNNTVWHRPRFQLDPNDLVEQHYALRHQSTPTIEVVKPSQLNGSQAQLDLGLDRQTGERLAKEADRSEPMWAALSILSGMILDPTDDLSRTLTPWLSLGRKEDRSLARIAAVRYNQIVISATQRALWSDLLDGENPAMPLVQLSASGYLPWGEEDGRFFLLQPGGGTHLVGYRTGTA